MEIKWFVFFSCSVAFKLTNYRPLRNKKTRKTKKGRREREVMLLELLYWCPFKNQPQFEYNVYTFKIN